MTTTRTQCEYYPVENRDSDDDHDALPVFAWDSVETRETLYMTLGAFLHTSFPFRYRLENARSMKNSDGNVVTIHDVNYIDISTGLSVDTIGYVHVWDE